MIEQIWNAFPLFINPREALRQTWPIGAAGKEEYNVPKKQKEAGRRYGSCSRHSYC